MNTKLHDGKIPKNTECPFAWQCPEPKAGFCAHAGINHNVDFSCGTARMLDLMSRDNEKPNVEVRGWPTTENDQNPRSSDCHKS